MSGPTTAAAEKRVAEAFRDCEPVIDLFLRAIRVAHKTPPSRGKPVERLPGVILW